MHQDPGFHYVLLPFVRGVSVNSRSLAAHCPKMTFENEWQNPRTKAMWHVGSRCYPVSTQALSLTQHKATPNLWRTSVLEVGTHLACTQSPRGTFSHGTKWKVSSCQLSLDPPIVIQVLWRANWVRVSSRWIFQGPSNHQGWYLQCATCICSAGGNIFSRKAHGTYETHQPRVTKSLEIANLWHHSGHQNVSKHRHEHRWWSYSWAVWDRNGSKHMGSNGNNVLKQPNNIRGRGHGMLVNCWGMSSRHFVATHGETCTESYSKRIHHPQWLTNFMAGMNHQKEVGFWLMTS